MNRDKEVFMQIKDLNLEGNIIDNGWIENLKYENGKTNMNAVMILSEIVYWYKPTLVKDEKTGKVRGYKKKFKADKLQKSYEDLGIRFGLTKRQVKSVIKFLVDKEIITIEFRTIEIDKNKKLNNVLFIEPIYENLRSITGVDLVISEKENPMTLECNSLLHSNVTPYDIKTSQPITLKRKTNTTITKQRLLTKITKQQQQEKSISTEENRKESNNTKTTKKANPIEVNFDNVDIEEIHKKIENKVGQIQKKLVIEMLNKHGTKKVEHYITNFHKFTCAMDNPIGFLIRAIEKGYSIPKKKQASYINQNKPVQSVNFDQREYDDEFFESLYDNLKE